MTEHKIATAFRGNHVYVYKLPDEGKKEDDMAKYSGGPTGGQIVLVPGVVTKVPSTSNPGEEHEIRLAKSGLVYCDCDGFRWRGHCSHIDKLIEQNPAAKLMVKAGLREKIAHLEKVIEGLDSDKE